MADSVQWLNESDYSIICISIQVEFYRKIHYLTREFCVKLHVKTDIARIAKR